MTDPHADVPSTHMPPAPHGTVAQTPAEQGDSAELSASKNSIVPGYDILGELGRGGMGVVYKARQLKLNRVVALKMILSGEHASPDSLARFLAEAEAVAKLQHPNIVQIHDRAAHNGLPFLTLEYIDGGSLGAKVRERPLPAGEAVRLVEQIARAVHFAHTRGIIHRDLKPDNVLLALDGRPKVTDFGLAKRLVPESSEASRRHQPGESPSANELTHTGAVMGTPNYMSPEQARGDKSIGPATDVWALGAILYRLVTGRAPFVGANHIETIRQVIHEDAISPSQLVRGLPRDVATICLKCLQKDPTRRYASAAALAADLTRWVKGEPIAARPVGSVERAVKWVRRNAVVIAATLAVLLALATGMGVSWWKHSDATNARNAEVNRINERDTAFEKADAAEKVERRRLRLEAKSFLTAGHPSRAVPILAMLIQTGKSDQPPINELLMGDVLLALDRQDDAFRYWRDALKWFNQVQKPKRSADAVALGFCGPWQVLAAFPPVVDPRYRTRDWEIWNDCEMLQRPRLEDAMTAFHRSDKLHLNMLMEKLRLLSPWDAELRRKLEHLLRLFEPAILQQISELNPNIKLARLPEFTMEVERVGWGYPRRNRLMENQQGTTLFSVGGIFFDSGLYAHASSLYAVRTNSDWLTFTAKFGIQDRSLGSAVFVVRGDGKELFRSSVIQHNRLHEITVSIVQIRLLELIVEDAGDGTNGDWALWLDPQLRR